jgi:hypothetical protein
MINFSHHWVRSQGYIVGFLRQLSSPRSFPTFRVDIPQIDYSLKIREAKAKLQEINPTAFNNLFGNQRDAK